MLFNSLFFLLLFLPLFLTGWYAIRNEKIRLAWLTILSFFFYGYWDYRFVGLMLVSILVDYYCGLQIGRYREENRSKAKTWMLVSVIVNLLILGFFKYFNFFVDSFYYSFDVAAILPKPAFEIILPVGISFYTFQSMSYSLDIYKREADPVKSLMHFSAYVSMFPQLIAGPIVRYSEVSKQLRNIKAKPDLESIYQGIFFFCIGLFKKVFIADYFAEYADYFFNGTGDQLFFVSWAGVLSYTFQIFFDFSAYSEMAVGLGLLFGFTLPQNFNSPYKANSFSDFWRRWHMTLSRFLRDYLYIPMGGNRKGNLKTYLFLSITMLIGGLWHGASWMFVIWGAMHGFYLAVERLFRAQKPERFLAYRGFVFFAVCLTWIFFRANSLDFAWHTFKSCLMMNGMESFEGLYSFSGIPIPAFVRMMGGLKHIFALGGMLVLVNIIPNSHQVKAPAKWWFALFMVIIFIACLMNVEKPSPFIYFQF